MNRKQQVAVAIMAVYLILSVQSSLDSLWVSEEEILVRFLDDKRISVDPNLEDLDYENLRVISGQLAAYIRGKTIISAVNVVLLVYLFASYLDMYRQTKAGFTLGLVFLSGALLSYSLFTNPVLLTISGGTEGVRIVRYFNFLPDLFTTVAGTILIYLSRQ
ncbi:hypothetical protein JXL21_05320 [Candidatus Bathyarchaeota archaeon]|nr:hypothetical protein [Candidatus Bathyarchaeota archaeon]